MGIASYLIFPMCHDHDSKIMKNEDIVVDFTDIQNLEAIEHLDNIGLNVHGIKNFYEIFATNSGHRILGYLDDGETSMWNQFYDIVFKQNPNIYDIQVHFWCSDAEFPFVIRKKTQFDCIKVFRGTKNNILYTKVDYNKDSYEESPTSFDKKKYIQLVRKHKKMFWRHMKQHPVKVAFGGMFFCD